MEKVLNEFTKYERARILGARALQISMDAPVLLKLNPKELEDLSYDSLKIAQRELDEGVLPISINRPLPERREAKLKVIKKEEPVVSTEAPVEVKSEIDHGDEIVQELEQDFEPIDEGGDSGGDESSGE